MLSKKNIIKIVALLLATAALAAAVVMLRPDNHGDGAGPKRQGRIFYGYFNTDAALYDYSGDKDAVFSANAEAFRQELEACHELFDIYHDEALYGVNNAATINKNAGGEAVRVDRRLIDLLLFSKEMYYLTDGAVNVAMGAVLRLWHDCREEGEKIPTDEELKEASLHCNIEDIQIDEENSTVRLCDPEMSLDLGSVAKGFAIDCAAKTLRERGADSYVIDVGGNLYAIGSRPDGSAFKIYVRNPNGDENVAHFDVFGGAVATSGDYQRYYYVNGVRYHHIIHHQTLKPWYRYRSVSVYASSAALSDAMSTALFNLTEEQAEGMLDRLRDEYDGGVYATVRVYPDGRVAENKYS